MEHGTKKIKSDIPPIVNQIPCFLFGEIENRILFFPTLKCQFWDEKRRGVGKCHYRSCSGDSHLKYIGVVFWKFYIDFFF